MIRPVKLWHFIRLFWKGSLNSVKIAFDGYEMIPSSGGVSRISFNLMQALVKHLPESELYLFTREQLATYPSSVVVEEVLGPDRGYFFWQNRLLFKRLRAIRPDVLIAPNYTIPLLYKGKSMLIEHDISFVSHPEWYPRKEGVKQKFLVRRSLKNASKVLTVSEFSRSEILRYFPFLNPEHIKFLYWGVEDKFQRAKLEEIHSWKQSRGLQGKTLIGYVGAIFNRRNIPELVEAVRLLRTEHPEVVLYVVGRDKTFPPLDLKQLLNEDWIRWETAMMDGELPVFYSALDAFTYPSAYEGFGLPPLEALACGTISVLLNQTSLLEIYHDMAVMVDKADSLSLKIGLEMALFDQNQKEKLLHRFQQRRPQFSWDKTGKEFVEILKDLTGVS